VVAEIHAIVNPISGGGRTRRRWPRLAEALEANGWTVRSHVTTAPGEATSIATELLHAGARELLSVGGDGTANEVANGFFRDGQLIAPEAVLSVMPTGTGHDFGRNIGIPNTTDALTTLSTGRICRIDVGLADYQVSNQRQSRCFLNAADVGVGALAVARSTGSRKLLGGFFTYAFSAAQAIRTFEAQPARVVVDGVTLSEGPIAIVLMANGRFHGGGMRVAPMAEMTDGFLNVFVLRQVPKHILLLSLLPRVRAGRHVGHPAVKYTRGRDVQVYAPGLPLEMDGEYLGITDVRTRVLTQALRVRVPSTAACT
jgi:diacylglycerol kinase (ATP)